MRRSLLTLAHLLLARRPFGLRRLGSGSRFLRPFKLSGRDSIAVGNDVVVSGHSWITAMKRYRLQRFTPGIFIGDGVYIGHRCCISIVGELVIGAHSVISEDVYVSDASHGMDPAAGRIMDQPLESKLRRTVIGENCFIGYGSRILPGAQLGDWCIVGSNSVVTRSFPAYSMVAGIPAKLIKSYNPNTKLWIDCRESR